MKLLRLIGGLGAQHGGPPASSLAACIAAQRAGAETTFAFPVQGKPHGTLAEALARLRADGVEIVNFPYVAGWGARGESWGVSAGLARWIRRNDRRFDLIHCHGAWQMATLLAAHRAGGGPPLVLTPHESLTDFDITQSSGPLTAFLKKRLRPCYARRIDLFVMASHLESRDCLPPDMEASGRVAVIPHPVFDESAGPPAADALNPAAGRLKLGFLGRLHAKKNVAVILQALEGTEDGVTLALAGSGPEEQALKALSATLGIDGRVDWLGFVEGDAKQRFFRDIDLLLLPSDYECFGMAAAEAMAHGVPVLTSPDTGIAEVIRAHGGGNVAAAEPAALRAAVENLSRDPDRIAELGRQAAAAAHNSLSFAAYGAAMMRHYETLLADR